MRKIAQWKDSYYSVTNTLYKFSNGVRLLYVNNPKSRVFYCSVLIKAGSMYERACKVPDGTAHFLEHMMCNPNKVFKTQEDIEVFCFGDKNKPKVDKNATVDPRHITFYAYANKGGAKRVVDLLAAEMDYPMDRMAEYVEKERKVILAEMQGMKKEEKDTYLQYYKYLNGKGYSDCSKRVVGNERSFKKVKLKDLYKYHEITTVAENVIITIQANGELDREILNVVEKMAMLFKPGKMSAAVKFSDLKNKFVVRHFHEEERQNGVSMDFSYYWKRPKGNSIESDELIRWVRLKSLAGSLLSFLGYMDLREKQNLIYSLSTFHELLNNDWDIIGFYVDCEKQNAQAVVNELRGLIDHKMVEYLQSEHGRKWFESELSKYIFQLNINYDGDYSDSVARTILNDGPYIFDWRRVKRIAKSLHIEDLIGYVEELRDGFNRTHVWIVSPEKDGRYLERIVKSSHARK